MNKQELLDLIKDMEDTAEVDNILAETDLAKSILTVDRIKPLLENEPDLRSHIDSLKDKHLAKGLETFKKNNLEKLVQAELLKRNPNKTPEQLRIEELERKFEQAEKEKARFQMESKFKDTLNEKGIPSKLLDFVLSEDEETTLANITIFEDVMKSTIEKGINDKLKGGSYVPPKDEKPGQATITKEQFTKMGLMERSKIATENPELFSELSKI